MRSLKNIVFVLDSIADHNSLTQDIADAEIFVIDSHGDASCADGIYFRGL